MGGGGRGTCPGATFEFGLVSLNLINSVKVTLEKLDCSSKGQYREARDTEIMSQ